MSTRQYAVQLEDKVVWRPCTTAGFQTGRGSGNPLVHTERTEQYITTWVPNQIKETVGG